MKIFLSVLLCLGLALTADAGTQLTMHQLERNYELEWEKPKTMWAAPVAVPPGRYVERKRPGMIAASFFIPGLGQFLMNSPKLGGIMLGSWVGAGIVAGGDFNTLTFRNSIGGLAQLGISIWSAIDAARRWDAHSQRAPYKWIEYP